MKCFVLIICIFLVMGASTHAEEVQSDIVSVPLFKTNFYEPTAPKDSKIKKIQKSIKESASKGLVWVGGEFIDLKKLVREKLEANADALLPYFPNMDELYKHGDSLVDHVEKNITHGKMDTDAKAQETSNYISSRLYWRIADRIFSKNGIEDKARRRLWERKIVGAFKFCMQKATDYFFEGGSCGDALSDNFIPNLGLAISYELSRNKLAPMIQKDNKDDEAFARQAFLNKQAEGYSLCMSTKKKPADHTEECAVKTMRDGIVFVTRDQLEKTIVEKLELTRGDAAVSEIRALVWPRYTTCMERVGASDRGTNYEAQFNSCIDDLVINTGTEITQRKIISHKSLKTVYPVSQLQTIADSNAKFFNDCGKAQKKVNARSENGMLNVDKCEQKIINGITYSVVVKMFEQSAQSFFDPKSKTQKIYLNKEKIF